MTSPFESLIPILNKLNKNLLSWPLKVFVFFLPLKSYLYCYHYMGQKFEGILGELPQNQWRRQNFSLGGTSLHYPLSLPSLSLPSLPLHLPFLPIPFLSFLPIPPSLLPSSSPFKTGVRGYNPRKIF
jgi:hypothetical protein